MRSKPRNTVHGHLPDPYWHPSPVINEAGEMRCKGATGSFDCQLRLEYVRVPESALGGYWRHIRGARPRSAE